VSEQYATDSNLRARIDLHQRFSTRDEDWHRWLYEQIAIPDGARVLEVGCGSAELWKKSLDRLDPSWQLTLSDQSAGMIDSAEASSRTSARARRMTAGSSRRRPRPSVPRSPTTAPSGSRRAPA
jgi:trans-aconitate methyltransferase